MRLIKKTYPIARKNYNCMACKEILERGNLQDYSFDEKRELVKARKNKFQILKGEEYINQTIANEKRIYNYRAIPEIFNIIIDNNFENEDDSYLVTNLIFTD